MNTKDLRFFGSSDDCFEMRSSTGEANEIYDNVYRVRDTDGSAILVTGRYAELHPGFGGYGGWEIGVTQAFGEDEQVNGEPWKAPDWPVRIEKDSEYSVALVLTVPETAIVEHFVQPEDLEVPAPPHGVWLSE